MSGYDFPTSAAERYDRALERGRALSPVPDGCPEPQPTSAWPAQNVALLERYRAWLVEGGATRAVIDHLRLPAAGHVLGLALKPHELLDLDADLEAALAYVEAKRVSAATIQNSRHSLEWFRRFLRRERELPEPPETAAYGNAERYREGLPAWLLAQMERFLQARQVNWRHSRLAVSTYQFWQKHTRVWRWLFQEQEIEALAEIERRHLYAYMDERLAQGYAASSVNQDLYAFQAMLRFLQQRGQAVPPALLTMRGLKQPDSLPRFLTDGQVHLLREDLHRRAETAATEAAIRDRRLDLAAFYLLWQGGMRVCEVEDLALADLHLEERRLLVRRSKGLKDRTVYLTEAAAAALEAYLEVRGPGEGDYVFLYRHKQLSKDVIRCRMKAAGKRTGVKVTPHMLRHTFGTQLVNAACPITTIQALLGHRRLNSTMVYARVHDQTVADDYYAAMTVIEQGLQSYLPVTGEQSTNGSGLASGADCELLALVNVLEEDMPDESQRAVVSELREGILALLAQAEHL